MARKVAFGAGKGGVGKTTIVSNVGIAASKLGKDVILLDADLPMADLALSLGMDIEGPTVHEVLAGEVDLQDAIYAGPAGVKVMPAGLSLDEVRKAKPQKLGDLMDKLSEQYNLILIDGPPGLGVGALTVLHNSNQLVLITEPEVATLTDALSTKKVTQRYDTEPLGVVVSRTYGNEIDVPEEEIKEMLDLPILAVIPEDSEIPKSSSLGEPLMIRKPDSPSGRAFKRLAKELFGEKEE